MGFTRPLTSVGIFSRNCFNSLDTCTAALGSVAGICRFESALSQPPTGKLSVNLSVYSCEYSGTSVARALMGPLPWLFRSHS